MTDLSTKAAELMEKATPGMILTYRYRIKDRSAARHLRQYAVAVNQVWNYCNAVQKDVEARYRLGGPKRRWPSAFDLCKLTAGTSRDLGISAETINMVCLRYAAARDKARHSLRFRSSLGAKRALGWVPVKKTWVRIDGNSLIYYGRTFRWFGAKRRPLPDGRRNMEFVEDSRGRWYVCFEVDVARDEAGASASVGVDLGLKVLATTSNGHAIAAPQFYRAHERKLAVAERAGNKRRVRSLHAKITNCRHDFLHKTSTDLVRNHGLIAVGNVSASKLARTRMAKSVLDAGWSTFRSMLSYKCQQAGALYLEVDEKFTTQTCSSCGSLPPERPQGIAGIGIRAWTCSDCGESHDRDVNAARNILRIALSAQRPVGGSHGSDKHDPEGAENGNR
jgi:putative transposase